MTDERAPEAPRSYRGEGVEVPKLRAMQEHALEPLYEQWYRAVMADGEKRRKAGHYPHDLYVQALDIKRAIAFGMDIAAAETEASHG